MNTTEAKSIGIKSAVRIEHGQVCQAVSSMVENSRRMRMKRCYYKVKWGLVEWIMGHYRRRLYRHVQRVLHKFNLHYMPARNRIDGDKLHERHHWCQWCGLRGTTWDYEAAYASITPQPVQQAIELPKTRS